MFEDLYFTFEYLLKCTTIVYDPKPTYHYFQHAGGVTNSKITKRRISGLNTIAQLKELVLREAPFVAGIVGGTIANFSLQLLYSYNESKCRDQKLFKELYASMIQNKSYLLKSSSYSIFYKIMFLIACLSPKLYYFIKRTFIHLKKNNGEVSK